MTTTRQKAIRNGENTYIGSVCKNGHLSPRYVGNKACIACTRIYDKVYRVENRERNNLNKRIRRSLTPDIQRAQRKRDLPSQRRSDAKRRIAIRGTKGKALKADILAIREIQKGRCAYCGGEESLHLDHKVPLSRGGSHIEANLQWLCGRCNTRKGTKTDAEFRAEKGIPDLTEWEGL